MVEEVLEEVFIADVEGPPRRRMYLYRDPLVTVSGQTQGWCFVVEDVLDGGSVTPIWDTWEQLFTEIAQYPSEYATGAYVWLRESNGEQVTLDDLSRRFE